MLSLRHTALCLLVAFGWAAEVQGEPVQFNRDIRPLLNSQCFKCHGGVKEAGGLNLQFRDKALLAGETGEIAIIPGHPEKSAFIERLETDDKTDRMPKKEPPLPPEKIALLKQWIAEGAKWQDHWAYEQPIASTRSIDAIVEERLSKEGLSLSPEADFRTLARRASLDLIGLPPELARVEALEQTYRADPETAWRTYIDELLTSPAYGERWASTWLDLARYADSRGYEKDKLRDMWRYRDWVIDAFNEDKPYDQFVIEQLAGDLLPEATPEQVIATAFHRNTPQNDEGGTDDEEFRTYAVLDRLNTTFDALQATTIGCVQCHGHPYDPFVHREYYELMAFFNNTADADREDQRPTRRFRSRIDTAPGVEVDARLSAAESRLHDELKKEERRPAFEAWLAEMTSPVAEERAGALPKDIRDLLGKEAAKWKEEERRKIERHYFASVDPQLADLYKEVDKLRGESAKLPDCDLPIMQELTGKAARKTQLFHRGNWLDKAEEVQPATPKLLNAWREEYPRNRLGFARWMVNGENPLTARVHVNRLWEQLFGVGLVETLEDFGSQGDKPVYQELLDGLALRFQGEMKWSQKALLREIVLSRVYRQSSKTSKERLDRDPANRLLARGARFRLGHEQIRDQALAIGGVLSRKMYGKPVMPYQPPGVWLTPYDGSDWKTSPGEDARRRAVYTLIRRSATYPSMLTFDAPNREFCVVRRIRTNTPLQSLDLLNSPVFMEAAAGLAARMTEPGGPLEEQLARGLQLALLRPPRLDEITVLTELHTRTGGSMKLVANAILNLDEVLLRN